jgi:peroxiredoxin Q/BCP
MIQIGNVVPNIEFALTEAPGEHSFESFLGKTIVLYFYPKDNTSGCTLEAQGFRDHLQDFEAAHTVILGVSKDSLKSHQKFRVQHCLPFELIVDDEGKLCALFDVIKEKSMYGKKYMGIERSTFVISKEGLLLKEWRKVSVTGHVAEVLEFVQGLA